MVHSRQFAFNQFKESCSLLPPPTSSDLVQQPPAYLVLLKSSTHYTILAQTVDDIIKHG